MHDTTEELMVRLPIERAVGHHVEHQKPTREEEEMMYVLLDYSFVRIYDGPTSIHIWISISYHCTHQIISLKGDSSSFVLPSEASGVAVST